MTKIAKQYSVTDKTIKNWCIMYNIPTNGRGYWKKKKTAFVV